MITKTNDMRTALKAVILLSACLIISNFASAKSEVSTDKTKILFIGNSYTFWIEDILNDALKKSEFKDSAQFEFHTKGSTNLGYFAQDGKLTLKLLTEGYDVVVLQEWSRGVGNTTETTKIFHDALYSFRDLSNNRFESVLYMTWGRENAGGYKSYKNMHKRVSQGYKTAAQEYDMKLAPVALVWNKVFKELEKFERGHELYEDSIGHPSKKGQMLIASVFFKMFFNDNLSWYKPEFENQFTDEEWAFVTKTVDTVMKKTKRYKLSKQVKAQ